MYMKHKKEKSHWKSGSSPCLKMIQTQCFFVSFLIFVFLNTSSRLELVLVGILLEHDSIRLVALGNQADIVLDVENCTLGLVLDGLEIQEKIVLDCAGGIRLEIRVVPGVQLGGDTNVVVVSDHHVNVSRAVRVATHDLEQLRRGTGGVNGVLCGLEAVEPKLAVLVSAELASEVVTGLVLGVVSVVFAVGARLPHVEDCVGDTLAGVDVLDDTVEKGQLTVLGHVLDDAGAVVSEGCLGRPKGTENGGRGRGAAIVGNDLVVDFVDESV